MLNKEQYVEFFDGYHIADAVVKNQSRFYFVLRKINGSSVRVVRMDLVDKQLESSK